MGNTKIEWATHTWNISTGCSKVSAGCKNCYAKEIAEKFQKRGVSGYENGFDYTFHANRLNDPVLKGSGKRIFVNSMSDIALLSDSELSLVLQAIAKSDNTFLFLTKRAEFYERLSKNQYYIKNHKNIWCGVTVESSEYLYRINELKRWINWSLLFISFEPLIGDIDLNTIEFGLMGINWVIVGAETGKNARPCELDWVLKIQNECKEHNIPFFFKQWTKRNKLLNGKLVQMLPYDVYEWD